jgi:hypothetical protein
MSPKRPISVVSGMRPTNDVVETGPSSSTSEAAMTPTPGVRTSMTRGHVLSRLQLLAPSTESRPAEHQAHTEAPGMPAKRPFAQCVHEVAVVLRLNRP